MWGPDKHLEETPELMAAIDELRDRYRKLIIPAGEMLIPDGIVIVPTYRLDNDLLRIRDGGWFVEVHRQRAYTQDRYEPVYANPDLIFNHVLPALRRYMVLDDIAGTVDETKEP